MNFSSYAQNWNTRLKFKRDSLQEIDAVTNTTSEGSRSKGTRDHFKRDSLVANKSSEDEQLTKVFDK